MYDCNQYHCAQFNPLCVEVVLFLFVVYHVFSESYLNKVANNNSIDYIVKSMLWTQASIWILNIIKNINLIHYLGYDKAVDILIKYGVDVNEKDSSGATALHVAIETGEFVSPKENEIDFELFTW